MSALGTPENPFTHATGEDRRRKWCKCVDCGRVALCLPSDDFFFKEDGDPLRCEEPCYWKHRQSIGAPYIPGLTGGVQ